MGPDESVYLITRILTCGIWLAAGLYKLTHFRLTADDMTVHGIAYSRAILPWVIVLEIAGSAMLIVDWLAWLVCIAWLVFMVPATHIYHVRFLIRDRTIDFHQYITFWKNISIAGGLFAIILLDGSRPDWLF